MFKVIFQEEIESNSNDKFISNSKIISKHVIENHINFTNCNSLLF